MKALTIYQPWASLIMLGAKSFEFRHWDYSARFPRIVGQRIVIHAAARAIDPHELVDMRKRIDEGTSGLTPEIAIPLLDRLQAAFKGRGVLELAAGLGTVVIGKPRRVGDIFRGTIDSDRLDQSVYGWPLTDIRPFLEPSPCHGLQGFWDWPFVIPGMSA